MPPPDSARPRNAPTAPDRAAVEDLIRRARSHPLGLPYLLQGAPDSVAATFGVHAFVVDAARARHAAPPPGGPSRPDVPPS
jgi:hypothetical protein